MQERNEKSKKVASETQHARFAEAARVLGCDEDEAAFDEKLKAIARHELPEALLSPRTQQKGDQTSHSANNPRDSGKPET